MAPTLGGHHAFPGGLAIHEWVNSSMAVAWVQTYEKVFGLATRGIDVSIATAAPLWHDIHKPAVMQRLDDGSELPEQTIADTGGHHPLSGAEAIVRRMAPNFVIAMLSAHDAPSTAVTTATAAGLNGIQRLVNFSGDSSATMVKTLQTIAADYGIDPANAPQFNLFRNVVFSQIPDVRLYGALVAGGVDGVKTAIAAEADISGLGS